MENLMEQYLEYRKTLNLSRDTLKGDRVGLRKFQVYLAGRKLTWGQVTADILRDYSLWLEKVASSTRRKYLAVLKSFYSYGVTHQQALFNPFRNFSLLRIKPGLEYTIPTPGELRQILESIDLSTWIGLRDRAILELVYSSGLRADEAVRLNLADLDFANGLARIHGKGRKERVVPFGKTAAFYLRMYLKERIWAGNPALFQSRTGGRISRDILEERLNLYAGKLGLKFKFHSLRHACALHMLQNRAGVRYIQELLGHSRIETTQIYTRLLPLDLKEAHHRFHPAEKGVRHG